MCAFVINDVRLCGICGMTSGQMFCSCGENFCHDCYNNRHLPRNPDHNEVTRGSQRQPESSLFRRAIERIREGVGSSSDSASISTQFRRDEASKWFGVHRSTSGKSEINTLIETPRLNDLMEESLHHKKHSPKSQFPSLVSFVGCTSSGKSFLIAILEHLAKDADKFERLESPVAAPESRQNAFLSTTGEVHLYIDPDSFGTIAPMFYVDCEGSHGTQPLAAKHQREWTKVGKCHEIQVPIDRKTIVGKLYPQFLYIFSDVICYVTKNPRSLTDSAVELLEWSEIGAENAVDQHTLPALIIIINASDYKDESWVSENDDTVADLFFNAIEGSMDDKLRDRAAKYGVKTMRELFFRSYSSVYVHFIPLQGLEPLGLPEIMSRQIERLANRIRKYAKEVQKEKSESLARLDTKQLSFVVDSAFRHLAKGGGEPFDFGQCRDNLTIPSTDALKIAEFLKNCLNKDLKATFTATASVLGTAIVKHELEKKENNLIFLPSVIFGKSMQDVCGKAIRHFLDENTQCSFVDQVSGERCVNTKKGHAKGHQRASGRFLKPGPFVDGGFNEVKFLRYIKRSMMSVIKSAKDHDVSNPYKWLRIVSQSHRQLVEELRRVGGYPNTVKAKSDASVCQPSSWQKRKSFLATSVCYGCIFGNAAYQLPCQHVLCETCLRDCDEGEGSSSSAVLNSCIVCGAGQGSGWPFKVQLRPDISGLRVLALDGGGVRGIIQLVLLERLESLIGLDLPIGAFFDSMVGTGSGGIIALAIGAQGRTAKDFGSAFRILCSTGFDHKLLAKTWVIGWFVRRIRGSIYFTKSMETALKKAFSTAGQTRVFGMQNHCRVAVTTTIDKNCRLIANYDRGGGAGGYLNSELDMWDAALCTSATPIFFDPVSHQGHCCLDGGLSWNNPVQLAVAESQNIWAKEDSYDLVLSVGPGHSKKVQQRPAAKHNLEDSVLEPVVALTSRMGGEEEWKRYITTSQQEITARSSRLNIRFVADEEPALDDFAKVYTMDSEARRYNNFHEEQHPSPFTPILGESSNDRLELVAGRLRASLYYLRLHSSKLLGETLVFSGSIQCRLGPNDKGYAKLLQMTTGFQVNGRFYQTPTSSESAPMKLDLEIMHQSNSKPIRIDVRFKEAYWVTISGFPMRLKTLVNYSMASKYSQEEAPRPVDFDSVLRAPKAAVDSETMEDSEAESDEDTSPTPTNEATDLSEDESAPFEHISSPSVHDYNLNEAGHPSPDAWLN